MPRYLLRVLLSHFSRNRAYEMSCTFATDLSDMLRHRTLRGPYARWPAEGAPRGKRVSGMNEEVYILTPKARRFKCALSAAEIEQMLARRISWGGLGMYGAMCEYEPNTLFTVDGLGSSLGTRRTR